jgi:hypothetical protein
VFCGKLVLEDRGDSLLRDASNAHSRVGPTDGWRVGKIENEKKKFQKQMKRERAKNKNQNFGAKNLAWHIVQDDEDGGQRHQPDSRTAVL